MTTHEYIRAVFLQPCADSFGIAPGAPADVGHPDAAPLPLEMPVLGVVTADELVVDVAVYRHEGGHPGQGIGHGEIPDVPRMPDLIALPEVVKDPVIDEAMGIADQSDAHGPKFDHIVRLVPSWRSNRTYGHPMLHCKSILTCLFLLCGALTLCAQPDSRLHTESKKAIKLYRRAMETSRAALAPDADKARALRDVEEDLLKALEVDPGFADAERVLAALRFEEGRYEEARDRYAHVLRAHGADWIRDHFAWAESARHALDPAAMKEAMILMQAIPGVQEGPDLEGIRRTLKDADFMAQSLARPVPMRSRPMPPPVSTLEDEYFPSVWRAGEAIVFTRKVASPYSPLGQEDLFVSRREVAGGSWSMPEPLKGLNTPDNEGAASLSGDGHLICFTVCRDPDRSGRDPHQGSCDLYLSEWMEEGWGSPYNLGAVNTAGWESQPCLSPDGERLYFVRGVGRTANRKHDLFMAHRMENGQWGGAVRMADGINTPGREMRPFIHPDGRHFYFASDGLPGMGGMDLFVSTMDDQGLWGPPVNLGWPLNTPDDETGLVVASDGRTGYFSREVDGQLDLHVCTLPPSVEADPTAAMEGILASSTGAPLSEARISLTDLGTGEVFASAWAAPDGSYHVAVPLDRDFVVMAEARGHMLDSERITGSTIEGRVQRNFTLDPLGVGAEVILRNVFFASGSAELDTASFTELDRVGRWLEAHPGITLEVEGHTDDVGSTSANLALSEARAAAVRDYLISAGAGEDQLQAKGYGMSRPAAEGQSEEARRLNRRTALRVVGLE